MDLSLYNIAKIIHIVCIVSWLAALFYLPRLFVYHSQEIKNLNYVSVVKVQERRLMNGIAHPAMILSLVSGITMILLNPVLFSGIWLHVKMLAVVLLLIYHFTCMFFVQSFKKDHCSLQSRFFRFFNEIPTFLLLVIAVCVVLRF